MAFNIIERHDTIVTELRMQVIISNICCILKMPVNDHPRGKIMDLSRRRALQLSAGLPFLGSSQWAAAAAPDSATDLTKWLSGTALPGAIIGQSGRSELVTKSYGSRAAGPNAHPISPDLSLPIGSVGKLFVAAMTLEAIASEKLRLDDKLSLFLPDFPNADRITVEMLGRHRSAFPEPIADQRVQQAITANPETHWTQAEIVRLMREPAVQTKPDGSFRYSNLNTIMLALILEQIYQKEFSKIAFQWLEVKGLYTTRFGADMSWRDKGVRGYRFADEDRAIGYGEAWTDVSHLNPSWSGAGGNWSSSVSDLLFLGDRVLPAILTRLPSAVARVALGEKPGGYGFHIQNMRDLIGHTGDVPGFSCALRFSPRDGQATAVITNLSNFKDGSSPAATLLALL